MMKCVVFFLLVVLALVSARPQDDDVAAARSRGCRYILGNCVESCPVGTHAYATACGYFTPQATCQNPKPVTDTRGHLCDYSSCYCDEPTVRDEKTGECVTVDKCS